MSDPMPESEWKTHPGHPHYQASSDGRIRSLDRFVTQGNGQPGVSFSRFQPGRELKLCVIGKGYLGFDIQKRKVGAHRFVCEVFHGPKPTPEHEVRHLNGNPKDNRAENLCWGTVSENAQDRVRHGRQNMALVKHVTKCGNGHAFTPENTYRPPSAPTNRRCRECQRTYQRSRVAR